jgi:hypothetical protein
VAWWYRPSLLGHLVRHQLDRAELGVAAELAQQAHRLGVIAVVPVGGPVHLPVGRAAQPGARPGRFAEGGAFMA